MKFALPDIPLWLYSAVVFTAGVFIGYVTLFVPERSPGPVGLIYATAFTSTGPMWLWLRFFRGPQ